MAKLKRVHVVEDDEDITKLILFNLTMAGFQVSTSASGEDALKFLQEEVVDLVLLDVMLPGKNGIEVCRELKSWPSYAGVPIIIVTAKGEDEDVVLGLEIGADDYIPKPFSPKVLIARIRNALRHTKTEGSEVTSGLLTRGDLTIHLKKYEVAVKGNKIDLTPSEFQILALLAQKPGWVFSRSQIVDEIHGQGYAVTDRAIDFQMVGLRKKLTTAGSLIETVRGIGYRFRVI